MRNLEDYIFTKEDKIEFDQYGRPYIQHEMGRLMLPRKTEYNYTIEN